MPQWGVQHGSPDCAPNRIERFGTPSVEGEIQTLKHVSDIDPDRTFVNQMKKVRRRVGKGALAQVQDRSKVRDGAFAHANPTRYV